jgi:DNA-binding transcriptional regulator YhcF (GntR family)
VKTRSTNKYIGIAKVLETRVNRGDYALRKLPSENELAQETGVSRMTARKALRHLIDKGVLIRRPHGRLEIANGRELKTTAHQIAFLMPPVISEDVQAWQWAAEEAAGEIGGILRPVVFTDWNDVLIPDVLKGFDGVFLMQTGRDVPPEAIQTLENSSCPVVSLDLDLSESGIPSICLFPERAIWKLLDHIKGLGHSRIACFNTCKMNVIIQRRIDDWRAWKAKRRSEGGLFNSPGEDTTIDYGAVCAEKEFGRLLDERVFQDTAVLCTNVWTALGVEKAMEQRGLRVGKAISVCAVNDEMLAPWLSPTLTSLRMPNTEAALTKCIKWMISGGKRWRGSMLLTPDNVPLYVGESTGPVTQR